MQTTRTPRSKVDDNALYFTDNGRVVCGKHVGMTARFTGRDLSGQRIERVTDATATSWLAEVGTPIKCEDCGRTHATTEAPAADLPRVAPTIDTSVYRRFRGAEPRGRGTWSFVFGQRDDLGPTATKASDLVSNTPESAYWRTREWTTFAAAKKLALAEAKRRGATLVAVCP